MTGTTAPKKSIQERMRDAAVEQQQERFAEHRKVTEIVLGSNRARRRVGEIVKLGDDYVVEVEDRDIITWTTVVGGNGTPMHHHTQEMAVLDLIARRHDPNPSSTAAAAFYAGRVLGINQQ